MSDHRGPGDADVSDVGQAPGGRASRAAAGFGAVTARAGRRVGRSVEELFTRDGPAFRDIAVAQATSAAGDTLVTLALAGTLFFSVPSASQARANVALYLLLTLAPFAVIGPLLGRLLDRRPRIYRLAFVGASAGRAVAAVFLAWQIDSLWLLPAAFALLVLSRTHGISRNALLPVALPDDTALVAANGRLAWIGVLAGTAAALPGLLAMRLAGSAGPLLLAIVVYIAAATAGHRVPSPWPRASRAETAHRRRLRARHRRTALHIPRTVRLAQAATAGVRLLNGFLVLLVAFAFRTQDAPLLDFGAVLAAAGVGFALASLAAPRLARRLREEPMVVGALAIEAAAAFIAGQWFGLPSAAFLAAAAGFAWGTAKLAFDGLLQRTVAEPDRGLAFSHTETVFQLAWVVGAVLPTVIPWPTSVALVTAGLAALAAQAVYVAHLIIPEPAPPG